ncbi:MAG: UDP-N-acetylmuramoyl-tripeptide--D-alanyl-D-alanine ligase [Planctomycetes bacterium]|nr:UDP-N-acetylmuramoyl-tripeptide--D-alanyl-D-alanine ligase [Planctomycetota bacterium]
MSEFRIEDIVQATGAQLVRGRQESRASGVSTDTRTLRAGELFVALTGPNHDGNRFGAEAIARGATAVVLARPTAELVAAATARDAAVLRHANPRGALADLARWHRARLRARVVGITGSCGKTTTKTILQELLSSRLASVASPQSFNNEIGVPHTLFLADERTEAVVVEMGTNGPGEIARLASIARPTGGVLTNVGASHLAGLASVEGVAQEKGQLLSALPAEGFCVLNADCRWSQRLRPQSRARVISFSIEGRGDLNASDVVFQGGATSFRLEGRALTSPLLGLHNVQNVLAALCACEGLGIAFEEVLPALARLKPAQRRMERHELGGLTLIDDSYNANPESASASVRVLSGLSGHRRRVLVLGDMLELGERAGELHKALGELVAKSGIETLVLVGELSRATAAGALEAGFPAAELHHLEDTDEAIRRIGGLVGEGDVVLVKGSRRTGLDRLVTHLCGRRQEAICG